MQLTVEQIAHVVHEANRAIQRITRDPAVSPPWLEATQHTRESVIAGVRKALDGATPEELHEEWCRFKRERGWRHGRVKDEWGKTHPALLPYGELPEEQKVKDRLFLAIVCALAEELAASDR